MRVLGIDPGTRHFGWGIVDRVGTRLVHVAHGVIHTDATSTIAERLVVIERELGVALLAHSPTHASIETIFFAKDATAAAKLGHARGVALLVCARADLPIAEYPPARVKRTVANHGRADKEQVAQMIRVILGLLAPPPSDAADALALAVTHLQHSPFLPIAIRTVVSMAAIRAPTRTAPAPARPPATLPILPISSNRSPSVHTRKGSPV